jgi:hypothetical protein
VLAVGVLWSSAMPTTLVQLPPAPRSGRHSRSADSRVRCRAR